MGISCPWRFAFTAMKANSNKASQDNCKFFNACVDYFEGSHASVLIIQQLAQTTVLRSEIGCMGGAIVAAYNEY